MKYNVKPTYTLSESGFHIHIVLKIENLEVEKWMEKYGIEIWKFLHPNPDSIFYIVLDNVLVQKIRISLVHTYDIWLTSHEKHEEAEKDEGKMGPAYESSGNQIKAMTTVGYNFFRP